MITISLASPDPSERLLADIYLTDSRVTIREVTIEAHNGAKLTIPTEVVEISFRQLPRSSH